jgi:hypothetical protein
MYLYGGADETDEKRWSGLPMSEQRFELGTRRIGSRNANTPTSACADIVRYVPRCVSGIKRSSDLYWRSARFESLQGHRSYRRRILTGFLSLTTRIPGLYPKVCHDRFHPHIFLFTIQLSPDHSTLVLLRYL